MKKQTIAIIIGILMLSFTTAMYAGNCETINLSSMDPADNIVYAVVDNSSNLEGLNVSVEQGIVSICTAINYKPDNFTIIFLDNTTMVEIHRRSHTKYVDRNVTNNITAEKIIYIDNSTDIGTEDCPEPNSNSNSNLKIFIEFLWILFPLLLSGIIIWSIRRYRLHKQKLDIFEEKNTQ